MSTDALNDGLTTSAGIEASATESQSQPSGTQTQDNANLLSALAKERELRKETENKLKMQSQKEQELQQQLNKVKDIDPAQYARLLQEQDERVQNDLLKRKEFDKAAENYRVQTEAANRKAEEAHAALEALTIRTATEKAFYENGGRKSSFDLSVQGGEDIAPVEAVLALFRGRVKLEDGKVVILNSVGSVEMNAEGRPKTLGEKMLEIRKGSMGALFSPENTNSGSGMNPTTTNHNGQPVKLYSKEQARNGKANIEDIAFGRAYVG